MKQKNPLWYFILNSNFQVRADCIFSSKYLHLIVFSGLLHVSRLLNKNKTKLHYDFCFFRLLISHKIFSFLKKTYVPFIFRGTKYQTKSSHVNWCIVWPLCLAKYICSEEGIFVVVVLFFLMHMSFFSL